MPHKKETKKRKKSALSFIEAAMVIIIIALLIAAVLTASNIIEKSKLATAQNLTKNAPVNGVESLLAWYEPTSEESLLKPERENGASISIWKDIKVSGLTVDAAQSDSDFQPTFSNKINGLRTVTFDGAGKYFETDATNLNNTNYTIIVVEKRASSDSNNYFIGDSSITTENENLLLGYSSDGQVIHSQAGSNSYTSSVSSYNDSSNLARVFTFVHSSSSAKSTYINGYLAGEDSDTSPISNLSNLNIGKDYNGEIGEIIIYNKALSSKDRGNVESYLGNKWGVEISHSSSSCTGGIITRDGCEIACSVSGITGITSPTSISAGTEDLVCNDTGYDSSDTVNVTCTTSGGAVTVNSGSCSCDEANDYYSYGGTCQGQCTVTSITGITGSPLVNPGAQTVTCNDTDNHFTGNVSGVCDVGTFTPDEDEACTCDTANNYKSDGEGGCVLVEPCTAVGGTTSNITVEGVDYTVHTFTAVSGTRTLQCPTARNVEVLVVGAGGSGSVRTGGEVWGAGGGGGGVVHNTSFAVDTSLINVIVGPGFTNGKGRDSSFSTITAYGGAAGEASYYTPYGSQGGRFTYSPSGGSPSQGYAAGSPCKEPNIVGGGGAGGAGGAGGDAYCVANSATSYSGDGGPGLLVDITGTPTYYGGGGCTLKHGTGGIICSNPGVGGGGTIGTNGTNGTGGGGGARSSGSSGHAGGSGIVIIRY